MKQIETYTDNDVVNKVLSGDKKMYEILIRRHNPYIYKIARSYGYNHHDSEDLMQETYIEAFRSLSKFEFRSLFRTWIIRIMLNKCYHKKLKFSHSNEKLLSVDISDNSIPSFSAAYENNEEKTINNELGNVIEHLLGQLKEEYRMVFTLRELNGLSTLETSEALGISESNVKIRLNRAKTLLKDKIKKIYSPQEIFEFNLVYCDNMVNNVLHVIESSL